MAFSFYLNYEVPAEYEGRSPLACWGEGKGSSPTHPQVPHLQHCAHWGPGGTDCCEAWSGRCKGLPRTQQAVHHVNDATPVLLLHRIVGRDLNWLSEPGTGRRASLINHLMMLNESLYLFLHLFKMQIISHAHSAQCVMRGDSSPKISRKGKLFRQFCSFSELNAFSLWAFNVNKTGVRLSI